MTFSWLLDTMPQPAIKLAVISLTNSIPSAGLAQDTFKGNIMEALQEVTVWPDNTINHTYVLNAQGWMVAYMKSGTDVLIEMKNPMKKFSKTGRKFKKVMI